MITYIAQVSVAPENHAAYEELMNYVAAQTAVNEPGVPYYAWAKSVDDPNLYLIVEVYRDVEAHTAHMHSDWVTQTLPKALKLMAGKPDIKQFVTPGAEPVGKRYVQ